MRGIAFKLAFCAMSFGAGMVWGVIAEAAERTATFTHLPIF